MQIYWTKINKIIDETSEVKTLLLDCPEDFTWEEGSFTHFGLDGFNAGEKPNKGLVRHMSISTLPREKKIGITTRIRKECSEFKEILKHAKVGDNVALFKTFLNVPLKRENKNIYLLSAGLGLATFRPIVLEYFERPDEIKHVHSLNIDSAEEALFKDIFTSQAERNFTAESVNNRADYYAQVQKLAADQEGYFYIVGSDEFLIENIAVLREQGIKPEQIMLDKPERQLHQFLPVEVK